RVVRLPGKALARHLLEGRPIDRSSLTFFGGDSRAHRARAERWTHGPAMAARAVVAASAHRPEEAAMARRWKVVVIVGPVLDSPGLAPGRAMIPPPRRAERANRAGDTSEPAGDAAGGEAGELAGNHPEVARCLVQDVGTTLAT